MAEAYGPATGNGISRDTNLSRQRSSRTAGNRTSEPDSYDEAERSPTSAGLPHHRGDMMTEKAPTRHSLVPDTESLYRFWDRFTRKGKRKVGVMESVRNLLFSSWLNLLVVFIPVAWVAHFRGHSWPPQLTFALCFLAIIPLEHIFDYGGDQMCFYVGKDLGDLIVITLNNAVEATLAIILLTKCEFRLLQSTIIGVIILHLLLLPGTAFITGGARIAAQDLNPHATELNHVLLTMGVLSLLLPAAFFAALDQGVGVQPGAPAAGIASPETQAIFLKMSRGIAILLLVVYVCSRVFLHNPPGDDNALAVHPSAPKALKEEEQKFLHEDPEVSQYVLIVVLAVAIAIMAATAEWLVESIEFIREEGRIQEEWFGLFLLPIVSWSADGAVSVVFFIRYIIRFFTGHHGPPPTLAKARGIDLSIQFTLFWMPFIVLLSWWTGRTFNLLFDMFEVAILLGSCFLVNYVTADAKTNWAEGVVLVTFYIMIALCAWFYVGQPEIEEILGTCRVAGEEAAGAAAERRWLL
ncbi:hypothetical protein HGRIS_009213 [Hohenbuehelia grisea]|uniref:Sodium/calcium exchanger membrane region domain-containing protein n=1 Tax=Hohenbuehelia grisea TaxID=104357 RepID=A0ABR3J0H3_9AGAR